MKQNHLDEMCYTGFIEYLNVKKVDFSEAVYVDIDYWFEEYVAVKPNSSKLKPRYFSTDGGHQLFN